MRRPMLDEQIDLFLEALAAEKGYSAHTIRAYGHDLTEFAAFAAGGEGEGEDGSPRRPPAVDAIDSLTVRGYLGLLSYPLIDLMATYTASLIPKVDTISDYL